MKLPLLIAIAAWRKVVGATKDQGISPGCTFYDTSTDVAQNCQFFVEKWDISIADFIAWNPAVKRDCSGIIVGHSYCVESYAEVDEPPVPKSTSEAPTAITTAFSEVKPGRPSPLQIGVAKDCTSFHLVKPGNTCLSIVNLYEDLSLADLYRWNPGVGQDCFSLLAYYYVCVGVGKAPTLKPPSAIGASTQGGSLRTCERYHLAISGDTCQGIVNKYRTFELDDFFQWNPTVDRDCRGLWAGYRYCVRVLAASYDFNDGRLESWKTYGGAFDASTTALVAEMSYGGKAILDTSEYTNVAYEADIRLLGEGSGNAGLVFRVSNPSIGVDGYRGYYAGIDSQGSVFLGRADDVWTQLASEEAGIEPGKVYRVEIRANADLLSVYVGGVETPKLSVRDETFAKGKVGVRVHGTAASFDNVKVRVG